MASKDLRKEQIGLLRFEKTVKETAMTRMRTGVLNKAAVVTAFAGVMTAAAQAAEKLGSDAPLQHAAAIKAAMDSEAAADSWLMNLAEIVGKGHAATEGMAREQAFSMFERSTDGGLPKDPLAKVVSLVLGLG